MSLVEVPLSTSCRIRIPACGADASHEAYRSIGVTAGRHARVLARYPSTRPRYVELELDGARLVTLPIEVAASVVVEPLGDSHCLEGNNFQS